MASSSIDDPSRLNQEEMETLPPRNFPSAHPNVLGSGPKAAPGPLMSTRQFYGLPLPIIILRR